MFHCKFLLFLRNKLLFTIPANAGATYNRTFVSHVYIIYFDIFLKSNVLQGLPDLFIGNEINPQVLCNKTKPFMV